MKLRKRPKGRKEQALDVFAAVVRSLTDLHVAERAGKGAKSVGKRVKKSSALKRVAKSMPAKVLGGAAVAGGAGALIAKKLKGGDPEPIYTPPAPSEPMAEAPAPEVEAVAEDAAAAAAEDASGSPADMGAEPGVGPGIGIVPEHEIAAVSELAALPELPVEPETAPGDAGAPGETAVDAETAGPGAVPDVQAADQAPADLAATQPPGEGAEEPVPGEDQPAPSS